MENHTINSGYIKGEGCMKNKVSFIHSISIRLIASFLVPIVGIVILGLSSYNKASVAITDAYKDQTQQTADVLCQYINLITGSQTQEFTAYLVDKDLEFYFKGKLDKSKRVSFKTSYDEQLRNKINVNPNISDIYFVSDGGVSLSAKPISLADDAYTAFEASSEGQIIAADMNSWHLFGASPELDAKMGTNSGTYAIRWVRRIKNFPQIIVIDFAADSIRDTMSVLDAGDDGYVAIVTLDGNEFFSDASVSTSGLFAGQDYYTKAVSSAETSGNMMVKVNGRNYLFVYSKFDEQGDMVAALIPESDMLSQTSDIRTLTMTITIVATIIAVLLAILISRQMSGTISYILRKLNKVAEGDLTTVLEPKGKDEFAMLCEGVNHTVGNVKNLIESVNEVSGQVSSSAAHMADASDTFKSTSGNIQSAVSHIEQGAGRLDSSSAECMDQMDTLSGRIVEVNTNAEEISRLTSDAGKMISEGMNSVQGLTASAEATTQITAEVITAIRELEEKSKAINDIVESINGIAKQTNLLSLNASIEAARAGEAGRGFAVVATQIRDLSAACMDSANQISDIVDEISMKTTDVVSIAGKAEQVVASQGDVVEQTKSSFNMINDQVNALIESLDTIMNSVVQMDESRAQTLKSIESITAVSEETAAYSTEVNDATMTQNSAIENLDEASKQLQLKADELISMMHSFTV